jgi:tetratricopeptide (TPR) repeat protein/CHAT domain-containing protein
LNGIGKRTQDAMRVEPERLSSYALRCISVACHLGLLVLAGCGQPSWHPPSHTPLRVVDGFSSRESVVESPEDDLLPALTNDGRYILFVSEAHGSQDIWLKDLARDTVVALTQDLSDDYDPAPFPDGQSFVFVSRREDAKGDLFIKHGIDPNAGLERLTDSSTQDRQPVVHPSGRSIFFTAKKGVGPEYIHRLELDTKEVQRVTLSPGFDPAISSDGKYLIYTRASRSQDDGAPRLMVLRLEDGEERKLTQADGPEGFACFHRLQDRIAFLRFPDDDDGNGVRDARDRGSLWGVRTNLEGLFANTSSAGRSYPLTAGEYDELFPRLSGPFLYFTQGAVDQDIYRLPEEGMFPNYPNPEAYIQLAEVAESLRLGWFALRALAAKVDATDPLWSEANYRIGRKQLERNRPDLALVAFELVASSTTGRGETEFVGLSRVERLSIERQRQLLEQPSPKAKAALLADVRVKLEELRKAFQQSAVIAARIELEQAELLIAEGRRTDALHLLDELSKLPATEELAFTAAMAALRRVELLAIAHDPDALSEAYVRVASRYPTQVAAVREAAERMSEVFRTSDPGRGEWTQEVDLLRRVLPKRTISPLRSAIRLRIARLYREHQQYAAAADELSALVEESSLDRGLRVRSLREMAEIYEMMDAHDEALAVLRQLKTEFGDVPGVASDARARFTAISLEKGARDQADGRYEQAHTDYLQALENDGSSITAYRRLFSVSQKLGRSHEMLDWARRLEESQIESATAHYVLALAHAYREPPEIEAGLDEVRRAIQLRPQFTEAYMLEGWLYEMVEFEEHSWVSEAFSAMGSFFVDLVGGIANVATDKDRDLEQAIEAYSTAVRLNPADTRKELEAELLLNLGNARYRLGEQASDAANLELAYQNFLGSLSLGVVFQTPLQEMVFWERVGRSAAWTAIGRGVDGELGDEWATSIMATRRAMAMAESFGATKRMDVLRRNLALAYTQAGEAESAHDILGQQQRNQTTREARRAMAIQERENARMALASGAVSSGASNDAILASLLRARRSLYDVGSEVGERPSVWLAVGKDITSAQFGFDEKQELDVNLSLAEATHRRLGDHRTANSIQSERTRLTREIFESLPSIALGIGQAAPITLGMVRERLGLELATADRGLSEGQVAEAGRCLEEAWKLLDEAITNESLSASRKDLLMDRARLVAFWVERVAMTASVDNDLAFQPSTIEPRMEAATKALADAFGVEEGTKANRSMGQLKLGLIDEAPIVLSSTVTQLLTSSVALAPTTLSKEAAEARAVWAHLAYARGLLMLRSKAAVASTETKAPDLEARLRDLDDDVSRLEQAREAFEEAVRMALGAEPQLGGRVLILSLHAITELDDALGDRGTSVSNFARALAMRLAEAYGLETIRTFMTLREVSGQSGSKIDEVVETVRSLPPSWVGLSNVPLIERLVVDTASRSLAAGDVSLAFEVYDWLQMLPAATGGVRGLGQNARFPKDFALGRMLAEADQNHQQRQKTMLRAVRRGTVSEIAESQKNLRTERAKVLTMQELPASDLAGARYLAKPVDPLLVGDALHDDEALLMLAPGKSGAELMLVEGSTRSDEGIVHRTAAVSIQAIAEWIASYHQNLRNGKPPSEASARGLQQVLAPFADRLKACKTLFIVAGDWPGPWPQAIVRPYGLQLVHLSSASTLVIARNERNFETEGVLRVGGESAATEGGYLSGETALALRPALSALKVRSSTPAESNEERLARLPGRAYRAVIVDAPFHVESENLARSGFRFGLPSGPFTSKSVADREVATLPLEDLRLSGQVLVIPRWMEDQLSNGRSAPWPLDLVGLSLGFDSVLLIPEGLPDLARNALLKDFLENLEAKGAASAISEAVERLSGQFPAVERVVLLGDSGLGTEKERAYAQSLVKRAAREAIALARANDYTAAIPAVRRWIRIQRHAGDTANLKVAYGALVSILLERVDPPRHQEAMDAQEEWVRFLETVRDDKKNEADRERAEIDVVDALVTLASVYSRTGAAQRAEAIFAESATRLSTLGSTELAARSRYLEARHWERIRGYERAASTMEISVQLFTEAGAYRGSSRNLDAEEALASAGAIYLNQLSDPERARVAYQRRLRLSRTPLERVRALIDLARVARRSGRFDDAFSLAEDALTKAKLEKDGIMEVAASIEMTNVAWYQGEYGKGSELCQGTLQRIQTLTASFESGDEPTSAPRMADQQVQTQRELRRLEVFARSACGLLAMSQSAYAAAIRNLNRAQAIARDLRDQREVANQYNNLGRVFLEAGSFDEAIENFQSALIIDNRLRDLYGRAYDLRNLGEAYLLTKQFDKAEQALLAGLDDAETSRDRNNQARALVGLADLAWRERIGERERARTLYERALPIAQRLSLKELTWRIHLALAEISVDAGDPKAAEDHYRIGVREARSITGRSGAELAGGGRIRVFDGWLGFLVDAGRLGEAFDVLNEIRVFEDTDVFEEVGSESSQKQARKIRHAETPTVAQVLFDELSDEDRSRLSLLRTDSQAKLPVVPDDAALVQYRVTDKRLYIFVLATEGLTVRVQPVGAQALEEQVGAYLSRIASRGEFGGLDHALSQSLLDPISDKLRGKQRVVFVSHRFLRYVPFAALPFENGAMVDRFLAVQALSPASALDFLRRPATTSPKDWSAVVADRTDGMPTRTPLMFVDREAAMMKEVFPRTQIASGVEATIDRLRAALQSSQGVVHFAGHIDLEVKAKWRGRSVDTRPGVFFLRDGKLELTKILEWRSQAQLLVVSGCASAAIDRSNPATVGSGAELRTLQQILFASGVHQLITATQQVDDFAAAFLMKHFYRQLTKLPPAEALREAQIAVRRDHAHPAWWALFNVVLP